MKCAAWIAECGPGNTAPSIPASPLYREKTADVLDDRHEDVVSAESSGDSRAVAMTSVPDGKWGQVRRSRLSRA